MLPDLVNATSCKLFVTGTDTHVGKTYISTGLLSAFTAAGYTSIACKPIASGCEQYNGKLYNGDALALQENSSVKLDYDLINPFAFAEAIAPHIAAQRINRQLSVALLKTQCELVLNYPADVCVIEGAGGWHTPLNAQETLANLAKQLPCHIILVVGMRLGCLNHAILTWQAIQQAQVQVCGWIANCLEPEMPALEENLTSLQALLPIPCLGIVPYNASVADCVRIEKISRLFNNRSIA